MCESEKKSQKERSPSTYRSMRQERYDLESWRHSASLVPRWDLMHLRYDNMICLHSPGYATSAARYALSVPGRGQRERIYHRDRGGTSHAQACKGLSWSAVQTRAAKGKETVRIWLLDLLPKACATKSTHIASSSSPAARSVMAKKGWVGTEALVE